MEQPDPVYKVFGLRSTRHRNERMCQVLKHYRKRMISNLTKERLLQILKELENEVSKTDCSIIKLWFKRKDDLSFNDFKEFEDHRRETVRNLRNENNRRKYQERKEREDLDKRECSVCMERRHSYKFPEQKITIGCNHDPGVCNGCISTSVNLQIPDVAWDQITCPECPEPLPFDVVKQWASDEAFERYDRKALMSAFRDVPNFTMCLGPGCDSGQIHSGGDEQPIMTCNTCHFKTCFTHSMPWHAGQTCAQYDVKRKERMVQEAKSENFIAAHAKKCPDPSCGHGIIKNGGCDHMTCRQCHYEFCYICLAPYRRVLSEGNSAHAKTCKYHTNNLPHFQQAWRAFGAREEAGGA